MTEDEQEQLKTVVKYAFGRASSWGHAGKWLYFGKNNLKEWLVDGGHKMFKVENEDGVNNWLEKEEGLDLTDKDL